MIKNRRNDQVAHINEIHEVEGSHQNPHQAHSCQFWPE